MQNMSMHLSLRFDNSVDSKPSEGKKKRMEVFSQADPGPGLHRHLQLGGRLPGLGADLARLGLRPRGRGEAARALHLHWSGQRGRG